MSSYEHCCGRLPGLVGGGGPGGGGGGPGGGVICKGFFSLNRVLGPSF